MNRLLMTLSLMLILPVVNAGELGRLFNTPQQRQQQEYQEMNDISEEGGVVHNFIIVNGIVQKQGGNRTVWINGTPQGAGRGNDNTPASVAVSVPGKDRPIQTKVGQKIMLEQPTNQSGE